MPQSGSADELAQLFTNSTGEKYSLSGQKGKKPLAHLELFSVTQSNFLALSKCLLGFVKQGTSIYAITYL